MFWGVLFLRLGAESREESPGDLRRHLPGPRPKHFGLPLHWAWGGLRAWFLGFCVSGSKAPRKTPWHRAGSDDSEDDRGHTERIV